VPAQRHDPAAGRPMLPSSSWMIAEPRMYWTPVEWCVQPTE
jgi:hypothetical protein